MSDHQTQIVPMLAYENGVEAMKWLCIAFGFEEKARIVDDNGQLMHGELSMGNSIIMIASPGGGYQSPKHHREICTAAAHWYQSPYIINGVLVYVDHVEKHYQQAKLSGARILSEIERGGPGTRYRAEDLEGQRWMFIERN